MSKTEEVVPLTVLALGLSLFHGGAFAAEQARNTYPSAFDRPPANEQPALTKDEQSKLRDELTRARDRQNSQVKTREAAPPKSKKP